MNTKVKKYVGDVFNGVGLIFLVYAGITSGWMPVPDPAKLSVPYLVGGWLLLVAVGALVKPRGV